MINLSVYVVFKLKYRGLYIVSNRDGQVLTESEVLGSPAIGIVGWRL